MGKKLNPILDPRGWQERPRLQLAVRPSLDELKKGKILFYDNTKLDFCNYREVFVRIKERFQEMGITNFVDYKETVRGKDTKALEQYAAMLAQEKPTAAVVALGDMGTSPATCIVAIALEKLGIPTVYITASPGHELVQGVAFYRAGHLCLCNVDIYQASTEEEVRAQIDLKWDYIIGSLTANGEELEKLANINFKLDRVPPAENLLLPVTERIEVTEDRLYEPGCYIEEIMDFVDQEYLGDGLPIIPPTKARYKRMLTYCPFDPEMVLAYEVGPSGKNITVKDVAIAAVMAGCKPEYMPILITAFKALANPKYNFLQSVTTSHPGGNLVLVSGPIAQEIGIFGGQGCLGPGFRANATIGRAVNLVIINVCRSVPSVCDLDCVASQAEFTYCFAEDPSLTPWETINVERFNKDTTCVLVLKAEPPHDIIDFLSQDGGDLLDTITDCCTTLGSNNAYLPGNLILVLTPDHAMMLAKAGYDKNKIREHIHLRAVNEVPMIRNRGIVPVRPPGFDKLHPMPVTRSPRDVEIVVAGGRGGHSAVILPWALHSEAIVEPVTLPNGKPARSIEEFRR
ncbi:hypothetical protein V3F56_13620 [Moorellaceae bacterium AZ2]